MKEAGNINKSLSVLGQVINNLVETAEGKNRHIPYRDSKLTFILKDSLGGNSKTCLIANVSPAASSLQETISTLKFAQRAKQIKNKALINENRSEIVEELQRRLERANEELENANREILFLREQLGSKTCDCSRSASTPSTEELKVKIEDQTMQYFRQSAEDERNQPFYEKLQDFQARYSQRETATSHDLSESSFQRLTEFFKANFKQNDEGRVPLAEYLELKRENEALKQEIGALIECLNAAPFITQVGTWWEKGNQNLEKTSEVNSNLDQNTHQLQQIVRNLQVLKKNPLLLTLYHRLYLKKR